jgi:four helix bundle protein
MDIPDIEERSMQYAVRAIRLFRHLKSLQDEVASILGRQYVRSATSVGANLIEARGGESKRDFIHKCALAQKEAREFLYWLNLLARAEIVSSDQLAPMVQENNELIAIITAIIRNTRKGMN